ncbi:cytochrome P450 2D14-like isoform X3 [Dendrobates tinctorius]|uniref:cytochrome P450 2D14-like isoform X3 n=1 Tax=Dendrobates tinctorius TaxID=92724 RepID=UPI003CC983D1
MQHREGMAEFISIFFSNGYLLGATFIVFLFILDFMKSRKNGSHFPPGPKGLPFLGNILQVDYRNPTVTFIQVKKEFGDVFSLQYFWKKMVVLNGFEVVKEVLINKSEDSADRPRFPIYETVGYTGDTKGIVLAQYGRSWKEQRRFAITTLRNFGMGKKSLEEKVTEEAQFLCSEFKSQKDQFDPILLINNAASNVICSFAFGERFEYNDEKFKRLVLLYHASLKAKYGLLGQVKEDVSSSFNEANLLLTTYDLFIAGSETTGVTLRWAVLFMILYPDVQSKVQEEIDRVIGRERKPTMGDVLQMPYTNAVIHEMQRYGDIVPLSLPHMTYRDMEIKGFIIPKGTTIITNLSSVLKDHEVWEKPLQFYPKHFLDENGKFVKREAFIPFSAGRRVCLGEQLARMELFLFFTTFLQQLTFEIPNDQPRPREDPIYALGLIPHPYNIRVVARV